MAARRILSMSGLTNPEFLDEAAQLGAELVKAQGQAA